MSTGNSNTKNIIIVLLSVGLLTSLYFNFTQKEALETSKLETSNTLSEKEIVLKDLEALKSQYSVLIDEKTVLNDELVAERNKVQELINQVGKSTNDINILKNSTTLLNCKRLIFAC